MRRTRGYLRGGTARQVGGYLDAGCRGQARPVRGSGHRGILALRPAGPPSARGTAGAGFPVGAGYAEIAPTAAARSLNGIQGPDLLWRSEVLQTAWGLDARDELRLLDPQTGG